MRNQKWFFLYALIITLIVFNLGIFMGYMLEHSRIDKINTWYLESELELLDQRIQKDASEIVDLDCTTMVEENIKFADKIFEEALIIQKYEVANRMSPEIIFQHKRFDLLRTLFWINSMRIKEKCNSDYHNIVYFYKYNNPSIEQESKQKFFSNLLYEIKQEKGDKVMLIPIAADNDLPSINLLVDKYGIEEWPVIIIDEKIRLTDIESIDEVIKYLD